MYLNLIERLKEFPPDRIVLVDGYEGGYDHIANIFTESVSPLGWKASYLGEFEDSCKGDDGIFFAVIISR